MNQKNNNFRHLAEHACAALTLSHLAVKEKYKDCPQCLIHYTENGNLLDYVEVSFDNQNASMTFIMDKEDNCVSASIHFYDPKDETLFIIFLRVLSKYYDTLSSSEYTFYPLKSTQITLGVIIAKLDKPFNGEADLFWDTFLIQISNTLEHYYLAQLAKKATLLDESDKLYKTLFNSISHELRMPVATIMGASDTLLTDSYPDNIKTELYGEILTASNRLNRLIENLLNISRLESGKIAPRIDWCDIRDLFNQVTDNLKDDLKNYHLEVIVPSAMPLVKLDFGLMEQVLHNLVYNSCKYSMQGTTIRLKALYDNEHLVLQEMDRGSGFPAESLPFVFNKFYKGDNQTAGGLGLGLSIVKGFVEAHKGTISVENRQNGGARFTIKIPTDISYSNGLISEDNE